MTTRLNALQNRRSGPRGERGQALVLFALMITVLVGMAGLVIDGSNLQENRRQLQNAADAAAFAGARDLPLMFLNATTDAVQWLTKNGSGSAEVTDNYVWTKNLPNDSITVSVKRNVPYSLAQVLGITNSNVTATATVTISTITGMSMSDGSFMPFAIFAQDLNGNNHQIGDIVTFRDDGWVNSNISTGNPNWNSTSSSFKGFMDNATPGQLAQLNVGDTLDAAGQGNACGAENPYITAMGVIYNQGGTIIVPVLDSGSDNGHNLNVHVAGFATLSLNVAGNSFSGGCGGLHLKGQIVSIASSRGITGGGSVQSWAACGTGIGSCKAVLTQ